MRRSPEAAGGHTRRGRSKERNDDEVKQLRDAYERIVEKIRTAVVPENRFVAKMNGVIGRNNGDSEEGHSPNESLEKVYGHDEPEIPRNEFMFETEDQVASLAMNVYIRLRYIREHRMEETKNSQRYLDTTEVKPDEHEERRVVKYAKKLGEVEGEINDFLGKIIDGAEPILEAWYMIRRDIRVGSKVSGARRKNLKELDGKIEKALSLSTKREREEGVKSLLRELIAYAQLVYKKARKGTDNVLGNIRHSQEYEFIIEERMRLESLVDDIILESSSRESSQMSQIYEKLDSIQEGLEDHPYIAALRKRAEAQMLLSKLKSLRENGLNKVEVVSLVPDRRRSANSAHS